MVSDAPSARRESLSSAWSRFKTERELLISVVGYTYGQHPELRINEIRRARKTHAERIMRFLDINRNDVVVDFGSGVGFIAEWIAPHVKQILCLDIGEHHLDYTRKHLAAHSNVECHLINYGDLSCLCNRNVTKFFSSAVFIHFNLWDITIHLQKLYNVLPVGAKAYINIMDSDGLDLLHQPLFNAQLDSYKKSHSPRYLVTWNSGSAVRSIAQSIGFSVEQVWSANQGNSGLLFCCTARAEPHASLAAVSATA
jgi:ubiquinone/menaquinone biosynthesis C-methylase UbiE